MHLLLPPSEAKRPGGRGQPLSRRRAQSPLAGARAAAQDALAETLTLPDAAGRLVLPAGAREQALAANRCVEQSPTMPAIRRYTGVVYDGLGHDALTPAAQRLARRSVWIFSGLFGVVRGDEAVPDYRVPAAARLAGVGIAGTFWRPHLEGALPALLRSGLIVDLRSTDYAAMWHAPRQLRDRVVTVRMLSPAPDGALKVISYNSKFAKGQLAAALLEAEAMGEQIRTADDIAEVWCATGGTVSPAAPVTRSGMTGALDLVTG